MTMFFPSEHLVLHWLEQPSAPRRKWKELLPWLLEERLLGPVEELLCLQLAEQEGRVLVLVVARAKLRSVVDDLEAREQQQGLAAVNLVPDYLALPWAENDIAVADRGDGYWVVRHGLWQGFAAPPALASVLIEQLLEQHAQARLRLWLADAALPSALRARAAGVEGRFDWHHPSPIAPAIAKAANLRSGEFAPQTKTGLPQWWSTAALLVLGLGLGYAALKLDIANLHAEVALLEKRQAQTVVRLFPGLNVADSANSSNFSSNIRVAVEQQVNGRFLQARQQQQPVAVMLQNLDYLLRDCRCELSALDLNGQGGSLHLPGGSAVEPFRQAGMQVSSSDSGITVAFTPRTLAEIVRGGAR